MLSSIKILRKMNRRRTASLVFSICAIFLIFFQARWAFEGLGADEACYREWLHRFLDIPFPSCRVKFFPGIAVLWIPGAWVAQFLNSTFSVDLEELIRGFTGLTSFLCWALSLFLVDKIWRHYIPKFQSDFRSWFWPLFALLNIPVLEHATRSTFLVHSGEIFLTLLSIFFLLEKSYFISLIFMAWLCLTRVNDAPILGLWLGAALDDYFRNKNHMSKKQLQFRLLLLGIVSLLVAIPIYSILKGGYGYYHDSLSDLLPDLSLPGIYAVLVRYQPSLLWVYPLWIPLMGLGCLRFLKLSWMSRAALLWMTLQFIFFLSHAIHYAPDYPPQFRYLVGAFVAGIIIFLEQAEALNQTILKVCKFLFVFGSLTSLAFTWIGNRHDILQDLLNGNATARYIAHDQSSISLLKRKLALEPIVLSPIPYTVFSTFKNAKLFSSYEPFKKYTLSGPLLPFLALLSMAFMLVGIISGRQIFSTNYAIEKENRKAMHSLIPVLHGKN